MHRAIINFSDFQATNVIAQAFRESDLPNSMTHYALGPRRFLYHIDKVTLKAFRHWYANEIAAACGSDQLREANLDDFPLLRPCLVASIKNTFSDGHPYKARVILDLDWNKQQPRCEIEPETLVREILTVLGEFSEIGDQSKCALFFNGFSDKPVSAHFVLCDYMFETQEYPEQMRLALNARLEKYGLDLDKSIATSGIKVCFADKWLAKESKWRGDGLRLVYVSDGIGTFEDLIRKVDPCVIVEEDECDFLQWKQCEAQESEESQEAEIREEQMRVSGELPIAVRLAHAVGEWENCSYDIIRKNNGIEVWIPQHAFCPFKGDMHNRKGKCHATVLPNGFIVIACFSAHCANQQLKLMNLVTENLSDEYKEMIKWGNEHFAEVHIPVDGNRVKLGILEYPQSFSEPIKLWELREFRAAYAHKKSTVVVLTGNNKRARKVIYWAKYWQESSLKRTIRNGFEFVPREGSSTDKYNLWRGFDRQVVNESKLWIDDDIEDIQAACSKILHHLRENICNGEQQAFDYLLNWCAFLFQKPEQKAEVALVITGLPGIGKGQFSKYLYKMVGQWHSWVIFNGKTLHNRFNSSLNRAKLVILDEVDRNDHKGFDGMIKGMLTEEMKRTEEKYGAVSMQRVFSNYIFLSNNSVAVNIQDRQRRWQCFDAQVPDLNANPRYFDELVHERENGGAAAFLALLMRRDIENWHPRMIFATAASIRHQLESLYEFNKWWYHCLRDACIISMEKMSEDERYKVNQLNPFNADELFGHGLRLPLSALHKSCSESCQNVNRRGLVTRLSNTYRGIFADVSRTGDFRYVILNSLKTCRTIFEKVHGLNDTIWK